MKRNKLVVLDYCAPEAELQRTVVLKAHPIPMYAHARKSHWGDLWPHPPIARVVTRLNDVVAKQNDLQEDYEKEDEINEKGR